MAENEASIGIELSVGGGPVPASAKLSASLKRGWASRGQEVLTVVTESVGVEELRHRLDANPELETLLARAINAAAGSALENKRRLLARIVQDAVLDDAVVDESTVILDVLEQVDAIHIRCLEAIARAEQESKDAGDWEFAVERAEKPYNQRIQSAAEMHPSPVIKRLGTLGLADATVDWSGHSRVTGLTSFGDQLLRHLRNVSI